MQFEVEVHRNEMGEWVAVAVAWGVEVTGRTENEALARIMDALAQHFKKSRASERGRSPGFGSSTALA